MFNMFFPDDYVDSTYQIEFEQLYALGYKGIIFDIDNTLVPHGAPADERCILLFERLKKLGFQTILLSNNKERRVKMFSQQIESAYIYKANKPSPANYHKAMEMMGTDTSSTIFIGDQLFTDVWGAKKARIRSMLVKPIDSKEEIQIVLKRYLEKIVLYFYAKQRVQIAEKRQGQQND